MKKCILLFTLISFSSLNCTSIHNVSDEPDSFIEKFNKTANGRKGTILLVDDQSIIGYDISMSADSTYWGERSIKAKHSHSDEFILHSIPTSDIKEIIISKKGESVLIGMGIGLLTGYSIASLICSSGNSTADIDVGAICGFFIGAPAGVILGGVVGGIKGSKDRFIISEEDSTSKEINDKQVIDNKSAI